jgi:hypothetical protein
MSFFDEDGQAGALKAGFLGFGGSGKTYTATLLMCAVREVLGLTGPLGMFDTESGSLYLKEVVLELTGKPLKVKRARDLDTLIAFGKHCESEGVSGAIVDSITHPWRELCESYLKQVNEARERKGWRPLPKLEFQHWGPIKERWAAWTNFYLNSPLSISICGRAGFDFDNETNEDGRKELVRTGVKMKTEGETGYEPSLLVYMEQEQNLENLLEHKKGQPVIHRNATVLKDRFRELDGQIKAFPARGSVRKDYEAVRDFFMPHLERLHGTHTPVDTKSRTHFAMTPAGEDHGQAERTERAILCDEIQHLLTTKWPTQTAADKKAKADLIAQVFGRPSWTYVESLPSDVLRAARDRIISMLGVQLPAQLPPVDPPLNVGRTDGASDDVPEFAPPIAAAIAAQAPPVVDLEVWRVALDDATDITGVDEVNRQALEKLPPQALPAFTRMYIARCDAIRNPPKAQAA